MDAFQSRLHPGTLPALHLPGIGLPAWPPAMSGHHVRHHCRGLRHAALAAREPCCTCNGVRHVLQALWRHTSEQAELVGQAIAIQVVARLGKEINDERSVCYWAWKNHIPIFCPALTDGSIGDMLFFHSYKKPGLVIDIVDDIRQMNDSAMKAAPRKTGIILLGGGECACPAMVCACSASFQDTYAEDGCYPESHA